LVLLRYIHPFPKVKSIQIISTNLLNATAVTFHG
jgi:hypothetical protein